MLLNLSDVFMEQGVVVRKSAEVDLQEVTILGTRYPVKQKSPVELVFTNLEPGKAIIEGKASIRFDAFCDRCLKETEVVLELQPKRFTVTPELADREWDEVDDLSFMEGYELNLETLIYNEIVENWPAKILCKEDCKGLCLMCGKNLNEGECGCDRFVPDPRMAAIKDLFNAGKEV